MNHEVYYIFLIKGQVVGHLKVDNCDGRALSLAKDQRALLYPNAAIAVFIRDELLSKIEACISEHA